MVEIGLSTVLLVMLCLSHQLAADVPIGQQKVLNIEKAVHILNYGVVFKGVNDFVVTNEYWRQTYEIILHVNPPRDELKADCITLPS